MSEIGRTPLLNGGGGKDHWPYTCAMICGPGITGGRVIGAFDDYYYGEQIDLGSGEVYDGGQDLSVDVFGATLLQLAGIDSSEWLPGVGVLDAMLT